eukprot:1153119-Pelagomonas_calceolata.AAC.13
MHRAASTARPSLLAHIGLCAIQAGWPGTWPNLAAASGAAVLGGAKLAAEARRAWACNCAFGVILCLADVGELCVLAASEDGEATVDVFGCVCRTAGLAAQATRDRVLACRQHPTTQTYTRNAPGQLHGLRRCAPSRRARWGIWAGRDPRGAVQGGRHGSGVGSLTLWAPHQGTVWASPSVSSGRDWGCDACVPEGGLGYISSAL